MIVIAFTLGVLAGIILTALTLLALVHGGGS
jgi:hypothetical protein